MKYIATHPIIDALDTYSLLMPFAHCLQDSNFLKKGSMQTYRASSMGKGPCAEPSTEHEVQQSMTDSLTTRNSPCHHHAACMARLSSASRESYSIPAAVSAQIGIIEVIMRRRLGGIYHER
jgi:hypothetical protein